MTGAWGGTERLGRCIEAMLPKASLPRSVQHRWALRQATQCPPGIYSREPIQLKVLLSNRSYKRVGTRRVRVGLGLGLRLGHLLLLAHGHPLLLQVVAVLHGEGAVVADDGGGHQDIARQVGVLLR